MANRMLGSPRTVRDAEVGRKHSLQYSRDEDHVNAVTRQTEEGVRTHLDRLREERALKQHQSKLESSQVVSDAARRLDGMDASRLMDFESEQYSEMAKLDAEIRGLAVREQDLSLGERLDDAKQRAVHLGLARPEAKDHADDGLLSRKERQERLVAACSARQEMLKRQREYLLAERDNISSELQGLQTSQLASMPHAETVNKIQMTRQSGHGPQVQDGAHGRSFDNSSSNMQVMVNQLSSRYHEDRRKLQLLREEHNQLQKEIESTKFSGWKPTASNDVTAAEQESVVDAQVKARSEYAREVRFEQARREMAQALKAEMISDPKSPETRPPADLPQQNDQTKKKVAEIGKLRQHWKGEEPTVAPTVPIPARTDNELLNEIQSLKYDYLSRGGKDSALLEAISALERQALIPPRRLGGMQTAAHIGGSQAVQAVYSQQASAPPNSLGVYGGDGMLNNMHPSSLQGGHKIPQSIQDELTRMDAIIEERKREATRLQLLLDSSRHSAPEQDQSGARVESDHDAPAVSKQGGHLTEEEQELKEMEANPKDTELYRLRKHHLKTMISLKYDIQRMQQENMKDEMEQQVELMKKEHQRREWVLKQQQQLLEAKYRKHMAREKPLANVAGQVESQGKDESYYSPDVGFSMYLDYVLGLPSKVNNQVQIVYGFYEGMAAKTDTKSLPMSAVEHEGASLRAVFAVKRSFSKVAANDSFKVIIELQSVQPATADRGPRTMPVGWTMLRLFEEDGSFNRGLWRMPMFLPPVRPDLEPIYLVSLHRVKDLEVFMRMVPSQQTDVHDRFSINPDMTKMQYKYPKELKVKEAEKPVAKPTAQLAEAKGVPLAIPGLQAVAASKFLNGQKANKPGMAGGQPESQLPSPGQQTPAGIVEQHVHFAAGSRLNPQLVGPTAALQIQLHEVTGSIFGHGHCQEPGPIFIRVSLVLPISGHVLDTTIGAHTSPSVPSPGLRVIEYSQEDGEEGEQETVFHKVQGAWCTSDVLEDNSSLVYLEQGCMFHNVPCESNTSLLLELYRAKEKLHADDLSAMAVKTDPDPEDTLIAWATVPLFVKSRVQQVIDEDTEPTEWSMEGLRLLSGVQEKALLSPPVVHGNEYDTVRLRQSKYADTLSCSGLASSVGGATVILNAPVPALRITIEEPAPAKLNKHGSNKNAGGAGPLPMQTPRDGKKKGTGQSIFNYSDSAAWIPSPSPHISDELFASDDGFDIYIDGARWMPDNVTLTSVTCYVANNKMQLYGRFEKEIDPRSMNVRCPYFLSRKEMRKDPSRDWDPTLTLLMQINGLQGNPADFVKSEKEAKREERRGTDGDTAESAPKLPCVIVGFAVLHVFIDPSTQQQPGSDSVREYVLNEGSFQIPLHRAGLKEKEDLTANALSNELRRLCSTVLVRIVKAARSEDGAKVLSIKDHAGTDGTDETELEHLKILVPPAAYSSAQYASSDFSSPDEVEKVLYQQRLHAAKSRIFSAAQTLFGIQGEKLTAEDELSLSECEAFTSQHFSDLVRDFRSRIKALFKSNVPSRLLDTMYSMPYLPSQGFLLSVDGVDNVTQDYFAIWTGALSSTMPQGVFYSTEGQVASDLTLFYQMDFQADASSPRLTDGWMWYRQRDTGQQGRLVAIIDIRMIVTEAKVGRKMKKLKNRQVVQLGFAILPVIGPAGNYVLSGNYRLPLYAMGAKPKPIELDQADQLKERSFGPSPKVLERLQVLDSRKHIQDALDQCVQEHEIHLVPGTSVVCRLVDRNRYGEFVRPFIVEAGPSNVDSSCIPKGLESKYKLKPAKVSLQKKLKDAVGSFSVHNDTMLEVFKTALTLPSSVTERPKSPGQEAEEERCVDTAEGGSAMKRGDRVAGGDSRRGEDGGMQGGAKTERRGQPSARSAAKGPSAIS